MEKSKVYFLVLCSCPQPLSVIMKKIYSIVVTFNGEKWIKKCLGSLASSSFPVHIIVVDNFSTDGTVDCVKGAFPSVTLLEVNSNLGFGQANNLGIKLAMEGGADAVFLLNQDAWVEPSTISTLVDVLERYPEYAVLSPIHFDGDRKKLDNGFRGYISETKIIDHLLTKDAVLAELYDVSFVNAAAWLLRSTCLEIVGGFDPIFYHYGEDSDYIHRVLFHGFKVGVVLGCTICHDRMGRRLHNLGRDQRVRWEVVNRLVKMKNILVADHEAVPSHRWLRIKYIVDQINLLVYRMIRQSTLDDYYVQRKVYKEIFGKLSLVKENRTKCKERGPTFLNL